MDETDLALLLLLIRDSRAPYSALAKRLKMSVPSVHKRITALQDVGVIKRYTANLAWPYLNAVPVMVWGISGIFPLREAVERLGKHDATRMVIQGSENSLYLQAHLRSIQDATRQKFPRTFEFFHLQAQLGHVAFEQPVRGSGAEAPRNCGHEFHRPLRMESLQEVVDPAPGDGGLASDLGRLALPEIQDGEVDAGLPRGQTQGGCRAEPLLIDDRRTPCRPLIAPPPISGCVPAG